MHNRYTYTLCIYTRRRLQGVRFRIHIIYIIQKKNLYIIVHVVIETFNDVTGLSHIPDCGPGRQFSYFLILSTFSLISSKTVYYSLTKGNIDSFPNTYFLIIFAYFIENRKKGQFFNSASREGFSSFSEAPSFTI